MANIKISELNELTTKADNDYIPIVDTSATETKKINIPNLLLNTDVLYSDDTGTFGDITLSNSAANYTKLEVLFKNTDGGELHSEIILSPNGKTHSLYRVELHSDSAYMAEKKYSINGTAFNKVSMLFIAFPSMTITDNYDNFAILKIVGYK